jgi:hypothetical protein
MIAKRTSLEGDGDRVGAEEDGDDRPGRVTAGTLAKPSPGPG